MSKREGKVLASPRSLKSSKSSLPRSAFDNCSSSARRVLGSYELLEKILKSTADGDVVSIRTILTSANRVCYFWNDIIERSLDIGRALMRTRALSDVEILHRRSDPCHVVLNQCFFDEECFQHYMKPGSTEKAARSRRLARHPAQATLSGLSPTAPYLDMFITNPPVEDLILNVMYREGRGLVHHDFHHVVNETGVTFGDLVARIAVDAHLADLDVHFEINIEPGREVHLVTREEEELLLQLRALAQAREAEKEGVAQEEMTNGEDLDSVQAGTSSEEGDYMDSVEEQKEEVTEYEYVPGVMYLKWGLLSWEANKDKITQALEYFNPKRTGKALTKRR